ncbi:MAG: CDP-alcohol phosphatidyltransferase family protein [Balneolaceae bacterium]|nr:MAG: CDP-alcohol phosphatidyltransferase family protein [Balneolaceae bacterium]
MNEAANVDGKKVLVKDDIFTWSNLISFSRVLVVIPIIWLHIENDYTVNKLIIFLICYGVLSDYLDGLVARWFDEISELGKTLDPVADKLMAFFLFFYTVILGWIPLWYFVVGVIRDLLIMAGSAHIKKRRGKVAMSIMSGKVSVNIMAVYWLSVFFLRDMQTLHTVLMIISVLFMVYSFIDYVIRYRKIIEGADFN